MCFAFNTSKFNWEKNFGFRRKPVKLLYVSPCTELFLGSTLAIDTSSPASNFKVMIELVTLFYSWLWWSFVTAFPFLWNAKCLYKSSCAISVARNRCDKNANTRIVSFANIGDHRVQRDILPDSKLRRVVCQCYMNSNGILVLCSSTAIFHGFVLD